MKLFLPLAGLLLASPLAAQNTGGMHVTLTYDRPGLDVPHWQIDLPAQGSASYTGKPSQGIDPGTISFAVSDTGREHLEKLLSDSKGLQPCETRSKGIANMGMKDLTVTPGTGPAQHCAFNFTDNKPLGLAADYLIGVATTVQVGQLLEHLHRYDRLGLDAVLKNLQSEAKAGRATEMGAIRGTLESLRKDDALMDRVRLRAQQLLDLADTSR